MQRTVKKSRHVTRLCKTKDCTANKWVYVSISKNAHNNNIKLLIKLKRWPLGIILWIITPIDSNDYATINYYCVTFCCLYIFHNIPIFRRFTSKSSFYPVYKPWCGEMRQNPRWLVKCWIISWEDSAHSSHQQGNLQQRWVIDKYPEVKTNPEFAEITICLWNKISVLFT